MIFRPADIAGLDYGRDLADPGAFPFTRGVYPEMYAKRPWTMRQYAGFGDARSTNARFRKLLAEGQTGLSVAFDLPTQIGYDPDHPLSEGEVGRVGVGIYSLADIETLFDGIPLAEVSTSMTINATAGILLALYAALAERRGVPARDLSGTVQNDILKEFASRSTQRFPMAPSMRLVGDVIAYCHQAMPRWNPISVSGYHMREAGCTAAQEIAFTLADGLAYLALARDRGVDVAGAASRFSFFFGVHNDLVEEVAKFRAARRLWARLARERFGIRDERACMLRFHSQTCGSTLTAQQHEVNTVRTAYQALAAVLGGTQSLHVNSRDEALSLPTEESALLALRTQQVLAFETGLSAVPDPLAGSYAVEAATTRLETEARELIRAIDDRGGAPAAIEAGWIQQQIRESAYREQKAIDAGTAVRVGVNRFTRKERPRKASFRIAGSVERARVSAVRKLRKTRREKEVRAALSDIERAARGADNLVPFFRNAVERGVTIGEICAILEGVWGSSS